MSKSKTDGLKKHVWKCNKTLPTLRAKRKRTQTVNNRYERMVMATDLTNFK